MRAAERSRRTRETTVEVALALDGSGRVDVATGLPFFDHMVSQLGRHGGLDLTVSAQGDLDVDAHHTVEDVGIVLGEALAAALGDKAGVRRFASMAVARLTFGVAQASAYPALNKVSNRPESSLIPSEATVRKTDFAISVAILFRPFSGSRVDSS